jgi:hypothetical protein
MKTKLLMQFKNITWAAVITIVYPRAQSPVPDCLA